MEVSEGFGELNVLEIVSFFFIKFTIFFLNMQIILQVELKRALNGVFSGSKLCLHVKTVALYLKSTVISDVS